MTKKTQGFTLIELIVVISIISIMAAYASFRSPAVSPFNLDIATKNLLNDIRLAKTLSMSLNRNYRIALLTATTYQIQDNTSTAYDNPASDSTTTTLTSGITLSPTATTIAFNTLGQSLTASHVLRSTAVVVSLTDGANTRSLTIEPQTGFVHE